MPQILHARQFQVPTEESPNLPIQSSNLAFPTTTTNTFGFPEEVTSTSQDTYAASATTTRHRLSVQTTASSMTQRPVAQFTTLITTNSNGLPLTIVGSIVSLAGTGRNGAPFESAVANGRTTVGLLEAAVRTTTANPTPSSQSPTTSPSMAPVTNSGGLSSGDIAAAVVVPILVLIGLLVGYLTFRRHRRGMNQPVAVTADDQTLSQEDAAIQAAPIMSERKKRGLPFGVPKNQRNYNSGPDNSSPPTVSGNSAIGQTQVPRPYTNSQFMSSAGASTKSNPFTDGSNRSASDGRSDAFTGFSHAATEAEHSGSNNTTLGTNTPIRAVSPMRERAFSPIPESDRATSRTVDDDAVSDLSDDTEYQDADVQVAQAHMGRAHRASVITMRGMGSEQNSSAENSPKSSSPAR